MLSPNGIRWMVMLVGDHVWLLLHLLLVLECRLWWGSTSRSSRCTPSDLLGDAVRVRWNALVACVFDSRVLIQGEFWSYRNVFRVVELYFRLRDISLLLLLLSLKRVLPWLFCNLLERLLWPYLHRWCLIKLFLLLRLLWLWVSESQFLVLGRVWYGTLNIPCLLFWWMFLHYL